MEQCTRCWGRGYKPERREPSRRNPTGMGFYARTCPKCQGTGQQPTKKTSSHKGASSQADLADIESGRLVPIPDFGGPSYVRKNHPAAALYAPCETPAFGTPAWDEAERKRAQIIASNEREYAERVREATIYPDNRLRH